MIAKASYAKSVSNCWMSAGAAVSLTYLAVISPMLRCNSNLCISTGGMEGFFIPQTAVRSARLMTSAPLRS